jgi:hypothetical protein
VGAGANPPKDHGMSKIVDEITENIRKIGEIVDRMQAEADEVRQIVERAKKASRHPLSRPEARIAYDEPSRLNIVR